MLSSLMDPRTYCRSFLQRQPGQRKGHNAICVDQNRVQGKMDSFTVEDSELPVQLIECLKFEAST